MKAVVRIALPAVAALVVASCPSACWGDGFPSRFEAATVVPGFEGLDMLASDITGDGQRMLLTVWSPARLFESHWNGGSGRWDTPVDMGFDNWDGYASLTVDEQSMYYGNHRRLYVDSDGNPANDQEVTAFQGQPADGIVYPLRLSAGRAFYRPYEVFDIWSADYDPLDPVNGFTSMQPVTEVNSAWNESYPYVTTGGNVLLFCSDRPGGFGGRDIYRALWNGSCWSDITNLGPEINSADDENLPFYCPSTATLYFSRGQVLMHAVPEPATMSLLAMGLAVLTVRRRKID